MPKLVAELLVDPEKEKSAAEADEDALELIELSESFRETRRGWTKSNTTPL